MRYFIISRFFAVLFLLLSVKSFEQPSGWACYNFNLSGGASGDTIVVENRNQFLKALAVKTPKTILIRDTIDLFAGESISIYSNDITILGCGSEAMIRSGGLRIYGNNVIIQNLSIGDSYIDGHWDGKGAPRTDALTLYGKNIWIDHCDLFHSFDGLLDIGQHESESADLITISWTRFSNHNKVMLVGSSDQDTVCRGNLRVTIHHCWFDGSSEFYDQVDNEYYRITQRMPRVRFGDVHVYNNYYENVMDYCVAARLESNVVVENNYFRNLSNPHFRDDIGKGIKDPNIIIRGNVYDNVKKVDTSSFGTAFNPATFYRYELDETPAIPGLVMNGAGKFNRRDNTAPIAINDTVSVYMDKTIKIFPLSNDCDSDNDGIRISGILNSPAGETTVYPDYINYIPPEEYVGKDIIEYQIIDYEGGSDTAFVLIDIESLLTEDIRH
ncbi:MAG: hypothetical protein JSV24_12295 [Bacteroidales bacterium]|nr:MAG: hypothetical protein JSV24_12295 [Bacteroidales bacterium]